MTTSGMANMAAMAVAVAATISVGGCIQEALAPLPPSPTPSASSSSSPTPTPSSTPSASPTLSVAPVSDTEDEIWRPSGTMPWHIQYGGEPLTPDVSVFNLDGAETSAERVAELRSMGARTICYFNAGGSETFRDDFESFPDDVMGEPLDGWPGEAWLDVRQLDVLLPIMAKRMDECAEKGFDGVDPDNMDGYSNDSGFPLTQDDALAYQRELIELARDRGLAIGLKNALELIPDVAADIDFAVNEQCQQYQECGSYADLIALDKPVFNVEYEGTCETQPEGFSTVIAELDLDGPVKNCR